MEAFTETIQIRCTPEDKADWKAKAESRGLSLSHFLRLAADECESFSKFTEPFAKPFNTEQWKDITVYDNTKASWMATLRRAVEEINARNGDGGETIR